MCAFIPASANWSGAMPCGGPRLDERRPGARQPRRIGPGRVEGAEEEVGEDDVEAREEPRVLKGESGEPLLDALGH